MTALAEAAVRHWDTVPPEAVPVREALPAIKPATRMLLHSWAWQQPSVRGWLLQRQQEYLNAECGTRNAELGDQEREERYAHIDAVVALDLLRWQCNCLDREAIEKLSGCAEVAALCDENRK